jgi:uncharacterized protein
MPPLTFRRFLTGPPAWRTEPDWTALPAGLATLGVLVAGQLAPMVALMLLAAASQLLGTSLPTGIGGGPAADSQDGGIPLVLLAAQLSLVLLTLAVAAWRGSAAITLHAGAPEGGARTYLHALTLMVPVLLAANAIAYALSPAGYIADYRQLVEVARAPSPWLTLAAVGLGAPLWEELLFRGFLLAPLAAVIGFWPAAVIASAAWTALHLNYSLAGLAEVMLIGLYFAWLLRRTGSVRVPIVCHAAYNSVLLAGMRYIEL